MNPEMQVSATESALALIELIKSRHGDDLLFHQSGGCCDGSAPMCFPKSEYMTGQQDVLVGEIGGIPFFMNGEQYKLWKHTNLIIDAIDGATFFLSTLEPTRMPDFEWISCFSMFFLNAAYFFMLMSLL